MPLPTTVTNFGPSLLVTSLQALFRSILFCMGLDHTFVDFFVRAAVGAAAALIVILFTGIGIPRRSPIGIHRAQR